MITQSQTERWWKAPKDKVHEALCGDIITLRDKLVYRSDQNLKYYRLYSNNNVQSLQGDAYDQPDPYDPDRLVLNIIHSVINAATAKISTNRPRCMPLTEGGDWELQQQAKQLTKFFDGQFYQSDIYRTSRSVFRDACIFGTGAVKFSTDWRDKDNPQILAEKTIIENIFVDPIDGRYCKPRMLHEAKDIGREVAMATWPAMKNKIAMATSWRSDQSVETGFADPITISEAWHLPSSKDAGDGRHVICTDTCTMIDEPLKVERFPISFFRWNDESLGFYGGSLAGQLVGIQVEINKILMKISQHMHLASSFIMANRGTKIVKEHLVNTPWSFLEYTGDAPVFATMQSISPEYFMQLDRLYGKAYENPGITQLFATGLKPKGLDSGKAQREYKDTESERFMDVSQSWEEFHYKDIPEILVDCAKEVDEVSGGYSVLAINDDRTLERIAWKDVNLDRDKYILQLHPTNFMPRLPAFKFENVKNLLEVSPELQPYALKLLDFPDVEAVTRRITAPVDYIEMVTDRMLYAKAEDVEDLFMPPEPFILPHIQQAFEIANGKLIRAMIEKAPPERLDLLMRYLTECERLMKSAQPPPMPGPIPPEMAAAPPIGMPQVGNLNISPEFNMPQPMPVPGA